MIASIFRFCYILVTLSVFIQVKDHGALESMPPIVLVFVVDVVEKTPQDLHVVWQT